MTVTLKPTVIGVLGTVTRNWRTCRKEDEWRPSKLQHYQYRPEYFEESWRVEEVSCDTDSSGKPSADTGETKISNE